jgi:5-methyltetrahydropteroyltriglutamate--homocysteine methyltransferase
VDTLIDDVGSFPLPHGVERSSFDRAYVLAREAIIKGNNVKQDKFLFDNFYQVVFDSFRKKCATGLDVVNYPQHFDMNEQFSIAVRKAMAGGTFLIEKKEAVIPELHVIKEEAEGLSKELGRRILLRVSITGPMELYLKEIGTALHKDVLFMFAENAKTFAEAAMLDSKYVKTEVVSLDEPSFGFHDIQADRDTIQEALEKAFDFQGVTTQIHLHSSARFADLLSVRSLHVLSFEYAASPKNIKGVSKRGLDEADKQIRVGISRTDINSILAELHDKGITNPAPEQLVESEDIIRKRFLAGKEKFGNRMTFTGPDCGLGGWPSQDAAELLLKRTVRAVKKSEI